MDIKLTPAEKIKVLNSDDLYRIMRRILLRENKIDQDREHQWVVGLAQNNRILFIELISMGSINATIVEPMEVFSFALQKRAVKVILVHNHPSGELRPSTEDLDTTDRMIQVGKIVNTPVLDHLIISTESYMSFSEEGFMEELAKSTKYVPHFLLQQELKAKSEELKAERTKLKKNKAYLENKIAIASILIESGKSIDQIKELTGLSKREISKIMKGEF